MQQHKDEHPSPDARIGDLAHEPGEGVTISTEDHDDTFATAATVVAVGAGVLIFEAALLPGLVLGIATMVVPRYLPKIGAALEPLAKSTVRGVYKLRGKAKEVFAGVEEQIKDAAAEVDAEAKAKALANKRDTR